MLSVLIPTLNEEANLRDCLQSVDWCDEVFVVDSGSKDRTPAIAREFGAQVIPFTWNGRLPKKKNWALQHLPWKHDWVLILDADERVSPELAREIQRVLQAPAADGFFINRKFFFMDRWIRHCGYYPSWNLRLFRHALGRYETLCEGDTRSGDNEVHEHVILQGKTAHLVHHLDHYAYPNIYTWVEKHNRYSSWEAHVELNAPPGNPVIGPALRRRRWLRRISRKLPCRPELRFFYSYLLKRGFLDGREGYILCRLLAQYELMSVIKAEELRRSNRVDEIAR